MPKGEAVKTIDYNPGEAPTKSTPVEDGNYELKLKSKGKPGPKGWRKKSPKSFPNRMLVFSILGTEDEITAREKEVVEFASLSPGFPLQRIAYLAFAAGYPKKLKLVVGPKGKPNDPSVMQNMAAVDELLEYIESEEVTLRAFLGSDSYNGEDRNKLGKWLSPDTVVESGGSDEDEATEESVDSNDDSTEADESSDEESDEGVEDSEETEDDANSDEDSVEVDADLEEETEADEEGEAEESSDEDEEVEEAPKKVKSVSLDSAAVKKAKAKQVKAKKKGKK